MTGATSSAAGRGVDTSYHFSSPSDSSCPGSNDYSRSRDTVHGTATSPNESRSTRFFSRSLAGKRQPQSEFIPQSTNYPEPGSSPSPDPSSPTSEQDSTSTQSSRQPDSSYRLQRSLVSSRSFAQKHLSTGSLVYLEGYLNKKVDMHAGESGHGWRVYKVLLKGSKLYFYKPHPADEQPFFQDPKDHQRHGFLSPSTYSSGHPSRHLAQHSSSGSVISPRLSIASECGMVLSAFKFESSTRTLLFEGNAKSLSQGSPAFAPPVARYVYGECFTEIDRQTMQFKKHVALLLFEDCVIICKRKWIRSTAAKVKEAIKFSSGQHERRDAEENNQEKRQPSFSGISQKSGDSRGSEGEPKPRSSFDRPTEKQRGYFTKWKHEATYPLSQVEALDLASPVPSASTTFYPFAAPLSTPSGSFLTVGRGPKESDMSSIYTTGSIAAHSHQTTSTLELVVTSMIDEKEYTHRLLFLPPSQEVRHQWYSKFNRTKELYQANAKRGLRGHELDESQGKEALVGASVNGLIHEIVYGNVAGSDLDLIKVFAATYRLFTTGSQVLDEIKRCVLLQPERDDNAGMVLRVESLIQEMIERLHPTAEDPALLNELREFTKETLRDGLGSSLAAAFLDRIEVIVSTQQLSTGTSLNSSRTESKDIDSDTMSSKVDLTNVLITGLTPALFLKMNPTYFSQQILEFHQHQMKNAGGFENLLKNPAYFIRQYPTAGSRQLLQSSFVFSMYSPHFLTVLITHHVLIATQSVQSTSRRPKLLIHWIQTARASRILGDMAGFVAIAMGVCSPGVVRLQETWKHVPLELRDEVAHSWVPLLIKLDMIAEDMQEIAIASFDLQSSLNTVLDLTSDNLTPAVPCLSNIKQSIDRLDRTMESFIQPGPTPQLNIKKLERLYGILEQALDSGRSLSLASSSTEGDAPDSYLQQYFGHLASISQTLHDQYHSNELSNDAFESSLACEPHFNGQYLDYHYKNRKMTSSFVPLIFTEVIVSQRLFPLRLLLSLESSGSANRKSSFDEAHPISMNQRGQKQSPEYQIQGAQSTATYHRSGTEANSEYPKSRQRTYSFPPSRTAHRTSHYGNLGPIVNMVNPNLDALARECLKTTGEYTEDMDQEGILPAMHRVTGIGYRTVSVHGGNLILKVKDESLESLVKAVLEEEVTLSAEADQKSHPLSNQRNSEHRSSKRQSLMEFGGPKAAIVKAGTLETLIQVVIMGLDGQNGRYVYENGDLAPWTNRQPVLDHRAFMDTFFATYRSFCSPTRLLDLFYTFFTQAQQRVSASKDSELPSEIGNSNTSSTAEPLTPCYDNNLFNSWKGILSVQLNVLNAIEHWLLKHFRDFSDDLLLKARFGEALRLFSAHVELQRAATKEIGHLVAQEQNRIDESLKEIKRLVIQQSMRPPEATYLGVETIETFYGPLSGTEQTMNDNWSAESMLEQLNHATIGHYLSVKSQEWFLLYEILESQSADPLGWYLPKTIVPGTDEDTVITDIYSTLYSIRRSGAPGIHFNGERLINSLPMCLQNLCRLHHVIRSWAIAQVASPLISYDIRHARIQKMLNLVLESREGMSKFEQGPSTAEAKGPMGSSGLVPSFVETAVVSALVSPECRAYSRVWLEMALGRRSSLESFEELLNAYRETRRPVLSTSTWIKDGLGQVSGTKLVPAVGWLIERMLETCCYVRDMTYESPLLINFDKRQYIYDLIRVYDRHQEQLQKTYGMSSQPSSQQSKPLSSPLASWLALSAGPSNGNLTMRAVREAAQKEYYNPRGGSAPSSHNQPNNHPSSGRPTNSRQVRVFSRLIAMQQEKVKRDQKELEKLERQIKETQGRIQKAQQEQAKTLEKQIKLEQSRSRVKNQLLKSTLMRAMRPISMAITSTWSSATTTVSNATAVGSGVNGKVMGSPGGNGSNVGDAVMTNGRPFDGGQRPLSFRTSFIQSGNGSFSPTSQGMAAYAAAMGAGTALAPKPALVVSLINATCSVAYTYTRRDFVFKIMTEEGGQSLLQAVDYDDMLRWIKIMNEAAAEATAKRRTLLDLDESIRATMEAPKETDEIMAVVEEEPERKGRNSVFGVELRHLMIDQRIPLIVDKCITEIEKRGLEEVGIYRVPGALSSINRLRIEFNSGTEHVDLGRDEWKDINVVAGALKQFLRELPEAVTTSSLYDPLVAASALEDYDERLMTMKDLIHTLPPQNYLLLKRIVEHLERVTDYEEINHMYATNLAIVFGPTLLRPGGTAANSFATSMKNLGHQQSIVRNMILQYHWLFDVEDENAGAADSDPVENGTDKQDDPDDRKNEVEQVELSKLGSNSNSGESHTLNNAGVGDGEDDDDDNGGLGEFPEIVGDSDDDEEYEEEEDPQSPSRLEENKVLLLSAAASAPSMARKDGDRTARDMMSKSQRRKTIVVL
ncbi:hypothetical protein BGW38_000091 [Lunasporangiospora selenospora]|uniref:PH domain-containing protein n=1 Tax=Lunasporangiospora selenospora TaxID=979761 RepID=A0A9P6FVL0_9FUNG|nr:hypothetical protein BGW38_000091 [Lunasporangiospora selenospora]